MKQYTLNFFYEIIMQLYLSLILTHIVLVNGNDQVYFYIFSSFKETEMSLNESVLALHDAKVSTFN